MNVEVIIGNSMKVEKFIQPNDLKTPVLFLVFNRLDTTIQVFGEIKKAKPPKLYIASDGARQAVKGEFEKVKGIRDYLTSNIDWKCEVKTLYRDNNLGCKYAISGAIDWFFDNEEMGIILEDDCLPSQSFFWFCERMLQEYKDDSRVMMITGTNYMLDVREKINKDYFFSRYFSIWGWATWKRAWVHNDVEISTWRKDITPESINFLSDKPYILKHFEKIFDFVTQNDLDAWGYQWSYNCLFNNGLCLTPSINLIKNIGIVGTHTSKNTNNNNFKLYNFKNIESINIETYTYPEHTYEGNLFKRQILPVHRRELAVKFLKIIRVHKPLKTIFKFLNL